MRRQTLLAAITVTVLLLVANTWSTTSSVGAWVDAQFDPILMGSRNVDVEPVVGDRPAVEEVTSSHCSNPQNIGDCAAGCHSHRTCMKCCSRGWPNTEDQEDWRRCRERCDAGDWEDW